MDDNAEPIIFKSPEPIWEWDVFGGGVMVATVTFEVPLWRRLITRIFMGSVWTRLGKEG